MSLKLTIKQIKKPVPLSHKNQDSVAPVQRLSKRIRRHTEGIRAWLASSRLIKSPALLISKNNSLRTFVLSTARQFCVARQRAANFIPVQFFRVAHHIRHLPTGSAIEIKGRTMSDKAAVHKTSPGRIPGPLTVFLIAISLHDPRMRQLVIAGKLWSPIIWKI